jgi:uncharacterized membrane protein YkvA (DUF1232 family)
LQGIDIDFNIFLQILIENTHYYQKQYQKFICVAALAVEEIISEWFCVKTKQTVWNLRKAQVEFLLC